MRGAPLALALALAFLLAPLSHPSVASADTEVGSPGSAAGQLLQPQGLAVDYGADLLYVADTGNDRIAVFDASSGTFVKAFGWGVADGTTNALQVCTTTCFQGIGGTGAGQLDRALGVAVDNQSGSPGEHDVYVYESVGPTGSGPGNVRLQKFTPAGQFVWMVGGKVNKTTNANLCTAASGNTCGAGVAGDASGFFNEPGNGFGGVVSVGPGGTVHVADQLEGTSPRPTRVQRFSPAGTHLGQVLLAVPGLGDNPDGAGKATALSVDSAGNLHVGTSGGNGAMRKYSPAGTLLFTVSPSFNVSASAIDSDGNLFVADNTGVSAVLQYDSSGAQVKVFYGSLHHRATGLAAYPQPALSVFAAENAGAGSTGRVVSIPIPSPGPVIHPVGTEALSVGASRATLRARVNAEGEATDFRFQYITDADFKAAGDSFGAGTQESSPPGSLPADFALHVTEAVLSDLLPETIYHFRVVAENPSGETFGPVGSFETKPPADFGDLWTTDVGTASATLHAEVNPLGSSSTARFQYVKLADFEASGYATAQDAPQSPIDLGAGETMQTVSTMLADLAPGTAYRYRLVVSNQCEPAPAPLCEFPGPEGSFTTLAPVAPAQGCPNDRLRLEGPGRFLPDCRAYEMVSPLDKNGSDVDAPFNGLNFPAALDQAATDGEAITYSTYRAFGKNVSAPYVNQYMARRDPSAGWASEAISPKREGPTLLFEGSLGLDRQYKAFTDDLCTGFLIQDARTILAPGGVDGFPGLYRRDNCGPDAGAYEALTTVEPPNLPPQRFFPEPQGFSADGSVAIFHVGDNLTFSTAPQPGDCVADAMPGVETCQRRLYEVRDGEPTAVCILRDGSPYPGACSAGQAGFTDKYTGRISTLSNVISDDGSRIFWTGAERVAGPLYVRIDGTETVPISTAPSTTFWTAAADGSKVVYSRGADLFEFDVDTETETPIASDFIGFMGASEDASRLYFASSQVLTEEANSEGDKAQVDKFNLYLYEEGVGPSFIGTLAGRDSETAGFGGPIHTWVAARVSRVHESGLQAAFMSHARLTGYDNTDANSGKAVMEVYLYDAAANGGEGRILCASCNPTGARPEGRPLTQKFLTTRTAAARIPAPPSELYASRLISDDGNRLYFNSFEALVARDTNGAEDVYQWEAVGTGTCTTKSPTHNPAAAGCVDLISSGRDPQGSEVVDTAANGRDVFFKTSESLFAPDPGLIDIYDARVGGGFAPPPAPPAACEGESCAPRAIVPAAPDPTSSAFRGAGNVTSKPRRPCPKGKRLVKRGGKQRCVKKRKAAKRKASNHRRAGR